MKTRLETKQRAGVPAGIEPLAAPAGRQIEVSRPTTFTPNTILVVDDHQAVRQMFAGLLRELGYEVVEAEGSLQAQRLASARGGIDLLLTDFRMPGMNGVQLAQWFHIQFPQCKVVVASAAPWEVEPYLRSPHDLVLMHKKDAFSRLEGIVHDLLHETAEPSADAGSERGPRRASRAVTEPSPVRPGRECGIKAHLEIQGS